MTAQTTASGYKQRVLAADIGTRSVIGLIGYYENGKLIVEHGEVEYHKDRVMIDGQIHDIDGVTESIRAIKEKLELASGQTFTEVAIAAAGRSLITGSAQLAQDIDETKAIEKHVIDSLEMGCLQQLYAELLEASPEMKDYFCIGHTVVHYYLNDKAMLSLLGHKGRTVKVDLIATFLPRVVVDSLYAAVSRIGLDVSYLTLEPIAAIEVAVPSNIRLLNIALVDIGAGTSDIAITKDGTVVAYAMTSTAGDEITEAIAKAYLMDFDSAELLKCCLCEQPVQTYKDIFGMEHEKSSDEILDMLTDVMDVIAKNIADHIWEKNGKAPSAVFLTGGGSKIPRLSRKVAGYLELPPERVSTRDRSTIPNVQVERFGLTGPEVITPIGILAKAVSHLGRDFVEVYVNGASVKLINTKTLKVIDALMLVGFNPHHLIAKAGESFDVYVNGRKKTVFGDAGEPGEIVVNGRPASISTPIQPKDSIAVVPAQHGKRRDMKVQQLIDVNAGFLLNGDFVQAVTSISVNGQAVEGDMLLGDQDSITYDGIVTVEDLRGRFAIGSEDEVLVNGIAADGSTVIRTHDRISIEAREDAERRAEAEASSVEAVEEEPPPYIMITYNGEPLQLPGDRELVFVNLFDYISFDRTKRLGSLHMTHNGEPVVYTKRMYAGDDIVIKWV
ncbi:pilus assembly protein PilM [Paenibacillus silvisoli]|uniref:pilus assembly protein PilM n=1 Tax=Paenibacillus silvisoli TaxID=3110539 RepID=UPI0028049DF5|nr:cell division FtsA domain-containing protein [Paenibacillus silvisoli]